MKELDSECRDTPGNDRNDNDAFNTLVSEDVMGYRTDGKGA